MGFFRSVRQLNAEAKGLRRDWDPVAQVQRGTHMMQAATAQLAEQNAAAQLAQTGAPATATIVAARDSGTRINHEPLVELDLLVTVPGRPPYPLTLNTVVPLIAQSRLQPGGVVAVRVDLARPGVAAVMWLERPAG
jgi:hypothetical protein